MSETSLPLSRPRPLHREVAATSAVASAPAAAPYRRLAHQPPFIGPAAPRGKTAAAIEGAIPDWLRGSLFRVAPMFGASDAWGPAHWFDGLALAGAIDFTGAATLTLRWSRLASEVARAAASGRVPLAQFATRNERSLWKRLVQPIPIATDNPNVNIVKMGGDLVALTESPWQSVLDAEDLHSVSRARYDDALGEGAFMLAHPILENGAVTNLAFRLGRHAAVSLYTHAAGARARRVVGTWTTPELPYLHSFGLTDKTAIIVAHPFLARPSSFLWSNRGFIDHFRWRPERGTRFILVDRESGAVREAETDAFFTFHVAGAFETDGDGDGGGGTVNVDLLAFDDAGIIPRLGASALAESLPALDARLTRFSIHRNTLRVERRVLSDVAFEFPHLDFARARGRAAATVYGASFAHADGRFENAVVAVDTKSGKARRFSDDAWTFGEPVFVGRPGRAREGDGVLLALGSGADASQLFVLDAASLEPLATARFDVAFPLGFHGSFARANG